MILITVKIKNGEVSMIRVEKLLNNIISAIFCKTSNSLMARHFFLILETNIKGF